MSLDISRLANKSARRHFAKSRRSSSKEFASGSSRVSGRGALIIQEDLSAVEPLNDPPEIRPDVVRRPKFKSAEILTKTRAFPTPWHFAGYLRLTFSLASDARRWLAAASEKLRVWIFYRSAFTLLLSLGLILFYANIFSYQSNSFLRADYSIYSSIIRRIRNFFKVLIQIESVRCIF